MAAFNDPRMGDALSILLGAGRNGAAEGQARVAKAQMDRKNQETLAREVLGNAILGGIENPRDFSTQVYGNAVKISDGFSSIAPQFNRGAQMGIYGTEGLGTRGAADLATGAGGAFSSTELGQERTIAGQNFRNARTNQAAVDQTRIEANAPVVLGEGEMLADPNLLGNSTFGQDLAQQESGGRYGIVNDEGYAGKYQFGQERLDDFNRAAGTNYTTADLVAGTPEAAALQEQVFDWHIRDIDSFIQANGLDQFIGQSFGNGVPITLGGMRAAAHLGGKGGLQRHIMSGGVYDPADSNGTRISDYMRQFASSGDFGMGGPPRAPGQATGGPGYIVNQPSAVLDPGQRYVVGGPAPSVAVGAVPGFNEATINTTNAQADERRANAQLNLAKAPFERTRSSMASDLLGSQLENDLAEAQERRANASNLEADASRTNAQVEAGILGQGGQETPGLGVGDTDALLDMDDRLAIENQIAQDLKTYGAPEGASADEEVRGMVLEMATKIMENPNGPNQWSAAIRAAARKIAPMIQQTGGGGLFSRPSYGVNSAQPDAPGRGTDPAPDVGFRIVE